MTAGGNQGRGAPALPLTLWVHFVPLPLNHAFLPVISAIPQPATPSLAGLSTSVFLTSTPILLPACRGAGYELDCVHLCSKLAESSYCKTRI